MTPFLLYSLLLASTYALAFFLLFGQGWLQLIVYWAVGLLGFAIGQVLANLLGISLVPIGQLNTVEASAVCLLFLFGLRALWRPRPVPRVR